MTSVSIIGAGMTRFGRHTDRSIEDLGREAASRAIADAGIRHDAIDEIFCGSGYGGAMIGQRIMRGLGLTGMPIHNMENACSSGATALREAVWAIRAGRAETILVLGVDQLSRFGGGTIPLETSDLEVRSGMVMPALYAMRARRYMEETGTTAEHLAMVSVKARRCGALNPYAQYGGDVTVEEVLASRPIADPLTLFMCCPTSDGAAALVVTSDAKARGVGGRPIGIAASALQSGAYKPGFRDLTRSELTSRTAALAYEQAGIGPEDVDMAEVHDAFAIGELMYYEALGFCGFGEAKALITSGETALGGRRPVNPSGGLLSKGHPVGGSGIAQICESVWQLRGEAGDRQVADAKVALTHCTGGGISGLDHGACAMHVLVA